MSDRLVVLGGTGVIGSRICELALSCGWSVVSIARRGRPARDAPWMRETFWHTGDARAPAGWQHHLDGAAALVACLGQRPRSRDGDPIWEREHGDMIVRAAELAASRRVHTFAMVSASEKPWRATEEYLSSRRRAELAVSRLPMRVVVLRAGLVVCPRRPASIALGGALQLASVVPTLRARWRSRRPLPLDVLARAVVRAANDPTVAGLLGPDELAELGE